MSLSVREALDVVQPLICKYSFFFFCCFFPYYQWIACYQRCDRCMSVSIHIQCTGLQYACRCCTTVAFNPKGDFPSFCMHRQTVIPRLLFSLSLSLSPLHNTAWCRLFCNLTFGGVHRVLCSCHTGWFFLHSVFTRLTFHLCNLP